MKGASEDELIAHCAAVAAQIPLVGFYLQPAVGGIAPAGRVLAPLLRDRQRHRDQDGAVQPLPHARRRQGVVAARAEDRVTLYTGNDDHIVLDLLVPFAVKRGGAGGAGAHQGRAARPLERVDEKRRRAAGAHQSHLKAIDSELLALDSKVTDSNSAFFDVAHDFAGCIAGCHEVLRRQGLFEGIWCLDPKEGAVARPGRGDRPRICRVSRDDDDAFVRGESGKMAFLASHGPLMSETFNATRWRSWRTWRCCWPGTCSSRSATCRSSSCPRRAHAGCAAAAELQLVDQYRGHRHRDLRRLLPRAGGRRALALLFTWSKALESLLHAAAGDAQHDPEGGARAADHRLVQVRRVPEHDDGVLDLRVPDPAHHRARPARGRARAARPGAMR